MTLQQKSAYTQHICQLGYLILLLLMILTSLPSELPAGAAMWPVLVIKLTPLLILLPGLWLNKLRSYIWLCFIVLFYFTQSVVETFLSLGAHMDLVITITTTIVFLAAMMHVKWERQLGRPL
ncbi:MAG: hypothetical protein C9356_04770 [Oleiphilus sp.]|nr:MAG: hypothetical protein C9356_04770 [Oleiphilus sp.]